MIADYLCQTRLTPMISVATSLYVFAKYAFLYEKQLAERDANPEPKE